MANATVFISSACIMVIELVAGRLIARHLGSSLYTWTSVIGVVLAGMALGNYVGGRLADRYPPRSTLALLFIVASAAAASITVLEGLVGDWRALWFLSWPTRVAAHVALSFFVPAAVLGMISPVVAKMALDLGRQTGRTVGSVYAWGVIGSLIGTFATGFYLIPIFRTMVVIWSVAGLLALMALVYMWRSWRTWSWACVLAVLIVLSASHWAWAQTVGEKLMLRRTVDPKVLYTDESQYSFIQIVQASTSPDRRIFMLDRLIHSQIHMQDLDDFQYSYEKIYAAVTRRLSRIKPHVDSLTIGGGGYVYPRWMDQNWPGSRTDVVEIDPAVTRAAMVAFGLPENTPIRYMHEDGRVYIDRLAKQVEAGEEVAPYDFVYCDAVENFSVPYQLTTIEFMQAVRKTLRPGGAYLMNLIDIYDHGMLVGSLCNTLKLVFPNVYVFVEGHTYANPKDKAARDTFIILAAQEPFDTADLDSECVGDCFIYCLSEADMADLARRTERFVLTDDHAPVENFLAPVVRKNAALAAVSDYLARASDAENRGDVDRSVAILMEGMHMVREHATDSAWAYRQFGQTLYRMRYCAEAEQAYRLAVDLDQRSLASRVDLSLALAGQGKLSEAADCLRDVLRRSPRYGSAGEYLRTILAGRETDQAKVTLSDFLTRAGQAQQAGNVEQAVALLREASDAMQQQAPDWQEACFLIGNAFYGMRQATDAERAYRRAVELEPLLLDATFNLAGALVAQGRFDEAADCYRRILELDPRDDQARKNLEAVLQAARQRTERGSAPASSQAVQP